VARRNQTVPDSKRDALRHAALTGALPARVNGGCMAPVIQDGDLVLSRQCKRYWPGDIVTHISSGDRLVCHRFLGYVRYRRKWLAITRADRERTHDAPRETEWLLGKIVKINGRDHSVSLRERVRASIHWLVALTLAMRRKITVFISPT
jgi:hypothetical protein